MDGWPDTSPSWRPAAGQFSELEGELRKGGSTAFMIVRNGELAFGWGDLARKSSVASVRKSLVGILYGIYAGEGRIDLDATLAGIGIDDVQPLTDIERSATIRDLLRPAPASIIHRSTIRRRAGRRAAATRPAHSGSTTTGISTRSARSSNA